MEQSECERYILHGGEERNLEYKGPVSWADPTVKAKLTKSILAMANLRDGGVIVIGVEQQGENFVPVGVHSSDFASFRQDDVAAHVAEYALPFVEITVSRCQHDQRSYVVIQVKEFEELPIICKRDGTENLRRGAMYTRSRRIYETAQVSTEAEMREIIELAVDKGIRKQVERLQRSGLSVGQPLSPEEISRQQFDEQLQGL